MRVAVANWHRRVVGGAESYIKECVRALELAGVELALLSEVDTAPAREAIELAEGAPTWCINEIGEIAALDALRSWRPDVIYVHLIESPALEARLLEVAPAVLFAHSHRGMCISGEKTFKLPDVRPCTRRFGWECLLHYYPHRCGGLSPITMWRDYFKQSARHSLVAKYAAIATASDYMRRELIAHGVKPERVHKIPMPVSGAVAKPDELRAPPRASATWRLLFLGRMSRLKGVGILLDAIPRVAAALNTQIELTFIGDGPDRAAWQENARGVQFRDPRISVRMAGWMKPKEVRAALGETDLLVVPSLCPETFGLVGVEAGRLGVPAAAFDVGGISEWLFDGVNGALAPGDPPSAGRLADAIVRCLSDPTAYARLRNGALEISRRFDTKLHVEALITIFRQVAEPQSRRESELGKKSRSQVVAQS